MSQPLQWVETACDYGTVLFHLLVLAAFLCENCALVRILRQTSNGMSAMRIHCAFAHYLVLLCGAALRKLHDMYVAIENRVSKHCLPAIRFLCALTRGWVC